MTAEEMPEATLLAQIDADLGQLSSHVNAWLQDRFLSSDDAAGLNMTDVAGLVTWLQQWHTHFESYGGSASPAVQARLAEIRIQIDASIASFTEMAAALPPEPED